MCARSEDESKPSSAALRTASRFGTQYFWLSYLSIKRRFHEGDVCVTGGCCSSLVGAASVSSVTACLGCLGIRKRVTRAMVAATNHRFEKRVTGGRGSFVYALDSEGAHVLYKRPLKGSVVDSHTLADLMGVGGRGPNRILGKQQAPQVARSDELAAAKMTYRPGIPAAVSANSAWMPSARFVRHVRFKRQGHQLQGTLVLPTPLMDGSASPSCHCPNVCLSQTGGSTDSFGVPCPMTGFSPTPGHQDRDTQRNPGHHSLAAPHALFQSRM